MMPERKEYAIYVITKHGIDIAKKILNSFPHADLYVSKKFMDIAPTGSFEMGLPMGPTLKKTFKEYDCHIHIISVGAVVRMIAPLLENKKVDPAIICVDDRANFSICVLSGHVGRGNFYTSEVSKILQNTPVITTASDVGNTLTVDILGRNLGWELEDMERNVTRGCAAVVNETQVLFVQEAGEPHFWPLEKELPKGVQYSTTLDQVDPKSFEILLISSDRSNISKTHPEHFENSIIYHPKTLVLGIGCDKDTPFEVVEQGVLNLLNERGLSLKSVSAIATIDVKKNESALLELSKKYNWKLHTFTAEELDEVEGIENPSETVKKYVGTRSVGEAACLLLAETNKLLMPKTKFKLTDDGKNMTLAVARVNHPPRPVSIVH